MYHLYVTTDIYRICQIFVARFRIWGGLSNALGRLSLPKPPRGAGAAVVFATKLPTDSQIKQTNTENARQNITSSEQMDSAGMPPPRRIWSRSRVRIQTPNSNDFQNLVETSLSKDTSMKMRSVGFYRAACNADAV